MRKLLAFCRKAWLFSWVLSGRCVGKQREVCSDLTLGFHQLLSRDTQNLGFMKA